MDLVTNYYHFTLRLGFVAGKQLLADINLLSLLLQAAEEQIAMGKVEWLIMIIEKLTNIHPFKVKMPNDWKLIVQQWVCGQKIFAQTDYASDESLDFISDGLVYRVVWGLEAIRTIAISESLIKNSFEANKLSEALTFGCHSNFGCWLLRKGLPSRQMVTEISVFIENEGLARWYNNRLFEHLVNNLLIENLYAQEPEKLLIWSEFLQQRRNDNNIIWVENLTKGTIDKTEKWVEEDGLVRLVKKDDNPLEAAMYSNDLDKIADIEVSS